MIPKIKTELCKVLHELSTIENIVDTKKVYDSIYDYDNAKHYRMAIERVKNAPRQIEMKQTEIAELQKTAATADVQQAKIIDERIKYREENIEKLQDIANKTVETDSKYFTYATDKQEDADEYLRRMMNIFGKPDPILKSNNLIPSIIKFTQTTITTCKYKNFKLKSTTEYFDILQLTLLENNGTNLTGGYSIQNLITHHERVEDFKDTQKACPYDDESTPTEDGSYNPSGEATTRRDKINISDENQYIIILLKRWRHTKKLDILVSIDSNITLDTKNYNLVGYISQLGAAQHGHYIYNDIDLSTNIKYEYDDNRCSKKNWTPGTSDGQYVYILLYKRQLLDVDHPPYKQTGTLRNVRNSCFLNAGMQLLHRIKPLWEGECPSIGGRKKKRTVTIKSESIPKTVKGLKTRKKLLKEKIKKAEKKVQLSKNRIIRLK